MKLRPGHARWTTVLFLLSGVVSLSACGAPSTRESGVPAFQVDPSWPLELPNNWILGQVSGIAVDSRGHVWIVHRPSTISPEEAGAVQDPPISTCCRPAPPVIEFDLEGRVVQGWGGGSDGAFWPASEHGIYVDHNDFVWIGSNGATDHVVMKFTREGQRVLTLGIPGETGGSNDPVRLGGPAGFAIDRETNEIYIADGYVNKRVVVFNAETGEYRRHWGAYGNAPSDEPLPAYQAGETPPQQLRNPVHSVRISDDGLVYVADRVGNRIQVFRRDGEFVSESLVAPATLGRGSVWGAELSTDPDQSWVYVPDGTNFKVWILNRADLTVAGEFGHGGRNAGQFGWVHNLAVGLDGSVYTSEVDTYKRVQKFVRVDGAGAPGS